MEHLFNTLSEAELKLVAGGADNSHPIAVTIQPTPSGQGLQIGVIVPVSPNIAVGPTVILNPSTGQPNGGGIGGMIHF